MCLGQILFLYYGTELNKQIIPRVSILGYIYDLPSYRDLLRDEGLKAYPYSLGRA